MPSQLHSLAEPPVPGAAQPVDGGDAPTSSELLALGITRTLDERFTVGAYRYTSIDDALAEARRQARSSTST